MKLLDHSFEAFVPLREARAPRLTSLRRYNGGQLIPEILKCCRNSEIATPNKCNDRLQIILLLSSDSDLAILHLTLDFEVLRLDRLHDFLGFVAFEPL
jgi:hypothetical protein